MVHLKCSLKQAYLHKQYFHHIHSMLSYLIYFLTSLLLRLLVEPPWSLAADPAPCLSTSLMSRSRLSVLLLISGLNADNLLSLSLGKLQCFIS